MHISLRTALAAALLPLAFGAAAQPRKPLKNSPKTAAKPSASAKESVPVRGLRPERVAAFADQRVTGVAVSKTGRLFVNFPYWEDGHRESVLEVVPGQAPRPYPDARWNEAVPAGTLPDAKTAATRFLCVQSVVVDDLDRLWVLDPASPKFAGVLPGGAKLVQFDLATNQPARTIVFSGRVAPPQSYLNDVRFDTKNNAAYLTDSGLGALVVLDLTTGRARRVLENQPSTRLDPTFSLVVNGHELRDEKGEKPSFNADGLELSADGRTLYFQSLMGRRIYRIGTEFLRDSTLSAPALAAKVEEWAEVGASDGYGRDRAGNLYTSGIEDNTIRQLSASGLPTVVAQGPEISWPDSFATGPDGSLYFTTSQIQTQAKFNKGQDTRTQPYGLWRLKLK